MSVCLGMNEGRKNDSLPKVYVIGRNPDFLSNYLTQLFEAYIVAKSERPPLLPLQQELIAPPYLLTLVCSHLSGKKKDFVKRD
jgi:hypothetical protein